MTKPSYMSRKPIRRSKYSQTALENMEAGAIMANDRDSKMVLDAMDETGNTAYKRDQNESKRRISDDHPRNSQIPKLSPEDTVHTSCDPTFTDRAKAQRASNSGQPYNQQPMEPESPSGYRSKDLDMRSQKGTSNDQGQASDICDELSRNNRRHITSASRAQNITTNDDTRSSLGSSESEHQCLDQKDLRNQNDISKSSEFSKSENLRADKIHSASREKQLGSKGWGISKVLDPRKWGGGIDQRSVEELHQSYTAQIDDLQQNLSKSNYWTKRYVSELQQSRRDLENLRYETATYKNRMLELQEQLAQREAELRRLQVKDFETNQKGPVLLDETARNSIEDVFIDQISTWTRSSFRGLSTSKVKDILGTNGNWDILRATFSVDGILGPDYNDFLEKVGTPAFFQMLITTTLVDQIFLEPFRDLGNLAVKESFDWFHRILLDIDTDVAKAWRSSVVQALEKISNAKRDGTLSFYEWDIEAGDKYLIKISDDIYSILKQYIEANPKLSEPKRKECSERLHQIIFKFGQVCRDWHKRSLYISTIRSHDVRFYAPGLKWSPIVMRSSFSAYKNDSAEDDQQEYDISAVVIPGFVKHGNEETSRGFPIVWNRASLALSKVDPMSPPYTASTKGTTRG